MLKKFPVRSFIIYGIISSVVYLIPAIIFIERETYASIWLLYLGNAFFLCSIFIFMIVYKKPSDKNTVKLFMLYAGHIVSVLGILISCFLLLLILLIFKPSFFRTNIQNISGGVNLGYSLFINAVIANISAGSFASIITSYASRSNYVQTAER
ncbi:MAG: hypothetical protein JO072_11645 [Parafilimonas sp.]|nr:hypothetical protein [Parafilimonas sp.]